ncbi:MAG: hypothetical protein PHH57_03525 [Candidatus Omnitrophica bacterium]|nr:hypothetical protein [Candidatus Omnitrophota bacterium]
MSVKRLAIIVCVVFLVIVALAVCVSARFSLSNITSDPYVFISAFFNQWSLALSAAGTIILAVSVFTFIYENRRGEEREKQQVIHALHNEIHWNLRPIITLRFDISEYSKRVKESDLIPTETEGLYRHIETRVFDNMRSQGQLHLLEEVRMDVVYCYSLIDIYNWDRRFKFEHLKILTELHERLDKTIRELESKFKFLPKYVNYRDPEGINEESKHEPSYPNESNDVVKNDLNNNGELTQFKPLPWGTLFFSFWVTLRVVDSPAPFMEVIAWFFLALSGILLLSVLAQPSFPFLQKLLTRNIPRVSKIINGQNIKNFFIPLVFFTTLIGFPTNIILSWSKLSVTDVSISVVGLVFWMIAYLLVLVGISSRRGRVGQILSGIISAIIVWRALDTFKSNPLAGWILVGIAVISIVIVILRPKSWNLWQMV